ncbi:MAG: NAD(P)-dependent oxidoreductase [Gammaproteobacteria bacterium]|nr:NAD(P)-dependent oxidoreductase [Gammaproteobacteria bacterium]MDH3428781.1 NAD(P)-dependent oxidoreductase [Gammaproteobacteria bacterium]
MSKIAFLGAGMMGQPMIRNFLRGGHAVTVYNRTLEKARPLQELGAVLAATPKEAASGADVIMSSLTNDDASRASWSGPDGALQADLKAGAFAVESSTVSLQWVSKLSELAMARGLRFLDCPVAGRPDVAEAGQLKVFAGGSAEDVDAIRPVFESISKAVMHVGGVGSGISFKLIYNVMGAIQVAACAEGMHACEAAGIDLAVAAEGFSTGATGSPHVVRHSAYMAENKHEDPVQFSGRMRIKDVTYGISLIESVGAQSVLGHATNKVFGQMVDNGMGDLNDSELIDTLRLVHGKGRDGS